MEIAEAKAVLKYKGTAIEAVNTSLYIVEGRRGFWRCVRKMARLSLSPQHAGAIPALAEGAFAEMAPATDFEKVLAKAGYTMTEEEKTDGEESIQKGKAAN